MNHTQERTYTDGTHLKAHIPPTFRLVPSFEFPIPTVTSADVDIDFVIRKYSGMSYCYNNHAGCNAGSTSAKRFYQLKGSFRFGDMRALKGRFEKFRVGDMMAKANKVVCMHSEKKG